MDWNFNKKENKQLPQFKENGEVEEEIIKMVILHVKK